MSEKPAAQKGGCWSCFVKISRSANVLDRRFPEDAVNAPEFYDDKVDTISVPTLNTNQKLMFIFTVRLDGSKLH